jgi:hypoxanthine phosphoribosyltransferase
MVTPRTAAKRAPGMPDSDFFELSWEFFGELCRVLAVKVAASGYRPDLVIGIAKAGVIPGAVVASILQCDFYSLKISRDLGVERVRARPKILSTAPREAAGKSVLIVDEICTSGETLRLAVNAVRQVNPDELKTATSLVKYGGYKPDFYALETENTVIFPWDRQVVNEQGEVVVNPLYQGAF